MTMLSLEEIAHRVAQTGRIGSEEIVAIRKVVYPDMAISTAEAEGIFAIERARREASIYWSSFFIEVITDYVLNQQPPVGYLSDANAAWLEAQVKARKQPSMDGDVALITSIIERATEVPPSFSAFALRLAKDAVVYGDGVDGQGREHGAGKISHADVELLQRILWGAGSEGQLAISREEAEALFAIADATTGADNIPEFDEFFARAIGNYLVGATGRDVPSRQEALEWSTRGDYKMNVLGAFSRMFDITLQDIKDGLAMRSGDDEVTEASEAEHGSRNAAREALASANAVMSPEKTGWLVDRITRNGLTSGPERALLRFVAREAGALSPELKVILDKVA